MGKPTQFVQPSLAELIDRLTIDQIKEVKDAANSNDYTKEMRDIEHDLDLCILCSKIKLNSYLIRLIIALAQINLHIWHTKETMQREPTQFKKCMKLAHQLNGLRNQIKNRILDLATAEFDTIKQTNIDTDNLNGWQMSVLDIKRPIG